jgi:hypothetical protein
VKRWRLAHRHAAFSAALVVLLAAAPATPPFARHLPPQLPDLSRLTRASGSAEMEEGRVSLQYELYFDPNRSNYEIIRYRLAGWDGGGDGPYSSNERLQWQAAQRDLRRFECTPRPSGDCTWLELGKDTPEYRREVSVIMRVLSLHRTLLHDREGAAGR